MNSEPQDDFLDQELRNAFQDYHLPPAEHMNVWAGVEARIATLPAGRASLTQRLAWPFTTAVLGVAVGWFLHRPADLPVLTPTRTAQTISAPERAQYVVTERPSVASIGTNSPVLSTTTERFAAAVATVPAQSLTKTVQKQPINKPAATQQIVLAALNQPEANTTANESVAQKTVFTDSVTAAQGPMVAGVDSVPTTISSAPAPAQDESASSLAPAVEHTAKALKPEGSNEKITYHKPAQRPSEQNRGIGHWFGRLSRNLRRVVGM